MPDPDTIQTNEYEAKWISKNLKNDDRDNLASDHKKVQLKSLISASVTAMVMQKQHPISNIFHRDEGRKATQALFLKNTLQRKQR